VESVIGMNAEQPIGLRGIRTIMISLQVSANLAEKTSDARAESDHATLIALHELSKQQMAILEGQNKVLDLLSKRAENESPS